jgi:predicted dehydrogenase
MIRVGVVGYGYWGPNLVRNFAECQSAEVVAVCDLHPERLDSMRRRYPAIATIADHHELLKRSDLDAIVIATPVSTHFEIARAALEAGKHVLVEKPLAATSEQVQCLIETAARRKRVLMVDHTFVYTGAVRKIRELITGGRVGEIYYYDSARVNLGLFQHDVNVLWDLAVHDLSIMDHLLDQKPVAVSATGISHVPGKPENIAYLTLFFDSTLIAHIHVNWLAPVKLRRTLIGGSREMVVYDDLEPIEKVKVYDKGITLNDNPDRESVYRMLVGYRAGDMWAPNVEGPEALRTEALHFLDCIENGTQPITGGECGLRVVRLLEAATRSMAERGRAVELREVLAAGAHGG